MRYFILGKEASIFFDPVVNFKVTTKDETAPEGYEGVPTKKMDVAVKHGHLVEVDGPEETGKAGTVNLKKLNDAALVAYYKENFDVSDEDEKTFKALSKAEKIKFLEE